jgi:hypothetical protein
VHPLIPNTPEGPAFGADLSGAQVLPETDSKGTAEAVLLLDGELTEATFIMEYRNLTGPITGVTLQLGKAGEDGPVLLTLPATCLAGSHATQGKLTCDLTSGDVKDVPAMCDACAGGSVAVNNISSLAAVMEEERVFVTASTARFPLGEVRGQIELKVKIHTATCDTASSSSGDIHFQGCSTITTK